MAHVGSPEAPSQNEGEGSQQELPTLTVVIPVFNAENYLRETLLSVEHLDYENIEIVIVNDGSTDESKNISLNFAKDSARPVKVISQPNSGEASAVNTGFRASHGKYLLVLSSDDLLAPNIAKTLIKVLEENEEFAVAYPDWNIIDGHGRLLRTIRPPKYSQELLIGELHCIPGPGSIIRRSCFREGEEPRDIRYPQISDFECWIRLSTRFDFIKVDHALASWRDHSLNQTSNLTDTAFLAQLESLLAHTFTDYPDLAKKLSAKAWTSFRLEEASRIFKRHPLRGMLRFGLLAISTQWGVHRILKTLIGARLIARTRQIIQKLKHGLWPT